MWSAEKAIAVAFVTGVVGLQAWAISPLNYSRTWYWPFINYPMYSAAKLPGDNFVEHALALDLGDPGAAQELVASGTGTLIEGADGPLILITPAELGGHVFTHYRSLALLAEEVAALDQGDPGALQSELDRLSALVADQVADREFEILLMAREYRIGEGGLEDRDPPWSRVFSWSHGRPPEPIEP